MERPSAQQIDLSARALAARMDAIQARMDAFEVNLVARMDLLQARLDTFQVSLMARMDLLQARFKARVDAIQARLEAREPRACASSPTTEVVPPTTWRDRLRWMLVTAPLAVAGTLGVAWLLSTR